MAQKSRARRQYLVNSQLQFSYSRLLILCVSVVILVFGLSLWYINKIHLELFRQIVGENALPQHYIDSVQNQLMIGIPLAIVIVACLLLLLGIYASHKIAGPMYRITKNLSMIGMDNQIDTIQIRKRDQLKETADAFNHMVHALKDRMYQDMRVIDNVRGKISQLHESLKGESLDIKKLSDQIREIDRIAGELQNRKKL